MAPLITRGMIALALLATVMAAVVIPEVFQTVQPTADEKALVLRNSLAIRTPAWNGDTSILIPRRNALTLFAITVAALGSVVLGACSSPFAALLGPYPCVAAVTAAVVVIVIGAFTTAIAANTKRAADFGNYFTTHYPRIDSGQSSFDRWQQAYDVDIADGLPVLVAQTNCDEQYNTCHKLWYSKSSYTKHETQPNSNHTATWQTTTAEVQYGPKIEDLLKGYVGVFNWAHGGPRAPRIDRDGMDQGSFPTG